MIFFFLLFIYLFFIVSCETFMKFLLFYFEMYKQWNVSVIFSLLYYLIISRDMHLNVFKTALSIRTILFTSIPNIFFCISYSFKNSLFLNLKNSFFQICQSLIWDSERNEKTIDFTNDRCFILILFILFFIVFINLF